VPEIIMERKQQFKDLVMMMKIDDMIMSGEHDMYKKLAV